MRGLSQYFFSTCSFAYCKVKGRFIKREIITTLKKKQEVNIEKLFIKKGVLNKGKLKIKPIVKKSKFPHSRIKNPFFSLENASRENKIPINIEAIGAVGKKW